MTISNSHLAYRDCYEYMDRALEDNLGVRLKVEDFNAATFLRMRIHQARQIDRRRNAEIYPDPEHPLHGASPYDKLMVRLKADSGEAFWVYIERNDVSVLESEPLSRLALPAPKEEEAIEVESQEIRQLPSPLRRV